MDLIALLRRSNHPLTILRRVDAAFQRQAHVDDLARDLDDLSPEQIRRALRTLRAAGKAELVGPNTWRPVHRRYPGVALAKKGRV